jgi:hypothetical protein
MKICPKYVWNTFNFDYFLYFITYQNIFFILSVSCNNIQLKMVPPFALEINVFVIWLCDEVNSDKQQFFK